MAERTHGYPSLGFLVALFVAAAIVHYGTADVSTEDPDSPVGAVIDCGTAISPVPTSAVRVYEEGGDPNGRVGCDKAITDRRLAIVGGGLLGLMLAIAVSMRPTPGVAMGT